LIKIDDAGSGSLIGGTGIGIMRKETEEYVFKVIPPIFFQEPYFSQKKYQQYVIKIVKLSFRKLNVSRNEPVKVCRGYIFDELRKWLFKEGYTWNNEKIEGALQYMVEKSFNSYVIRLGLPKDFVQHARFAFGFHRLLKWVFADFNNRSKYCKSGWKSWKKWSKVPLHVYPTKLVQDLYCLKCGELISRYETASMLEYHTNRTWFVPLHTSCCTYSYTQNAKSTDLQEPIA
jgi:hypothetical protein